VTSIKDLKSDHKNARRRTDRSASLIAESLKRYGAARSIVIDEDGRILAGNGTVEGAKKAGIDKLRIIEAEGDELIAVRRTGLTDEQKIGLAIADNRTSDLSEWDTLMLEQLSETHDISPWFEPEDLNALIGAGEITSTPKEYDGAQELDPENFSEFEHTCPRCGFEFNK
jgi:hypothetical protein